ncbi:probable ATP-dependent RNA helicase DDX10 [Ixodes scapularis]|uniref:probable ATP-dependent RNA helicase DDX10 n=1 Tax=Ixodes scapularis TaxID=6945 RepID=UPI001A9EBEEE|nr:probable ATP-dependent RNA helicase DDX10 [Ixodes scapularis]
MAASTSNMDRRADERGGGKRAGFRKKWNKDMPRKFDNRGSKESMKLYRKRQTQGLTEKEEIERLKEAYDTFDVNTANTFKDFPLSTKTQLGLKNAGFVTPTEIQKESIGLALKGLDILGAAKTGSGKTLAFVIPVLEKLYREMWSRYYGLGALIITPVRELAYQIFEVLKKVGVHHDFSAGLVIGGKDLKFERKRMDSCNIVICTPGRLLQHMDENPLFDATQLQILVLDEADRILDMGFQQSVNAILENLPVERQTLLFSATQTKSVKDLARLSLKSPVYVSVHENAKFTTPEALVQSYTVCDLHNKLNLLWSFIRSHLKQKILVFLSSCKQVKYVYRAFCRMRPGMTILELHGNMYQMKRMAVYDEFCRKQSAVLIATDIAARGLDFPAVNWVIQLDCPEDVNTYIHRAGRTARFEKGGEALLVLLPSEESMAEQLTARKIPINKILVNPRKFVNVQRKMEALCARDVSLKESAQRCFTAYLKSTFLMKDKSVFDVKKLDLEAFARSLGLAVAPRVRFLQKHLKQVQAKEEKDKVARRGDALQPSHSTVTEDRLGGASPSPWRGSDTKAFQFYTQDDSEDSDLEDIFTVKQRITYDSEENAEAELPADEERKKKKPLTKAAVAKKILRKKLVANTKVAFDEEGKVIEEGVNVQKADTIKELLKDEKTPCGIDLEISKKILQEEDKFDKQRDRERVKAMHRAKRLKLRQERKQEQGEVTLDAESGNEEEKEVEGSEEEQSNNEDSKSGEESHSGSEDADTDEERLPQASRSKRPLGDRDSKVASKKRRVSEETSDEESEEDELAPLDTGLDLLGDEALALHMLSHK